MAKNNKYKYKCVQCGKKSVSYLHNQKLCSGDCRKKYYGRFSQNGEIPSGTVGAVSELQVCADLLRRGYSVFRSVSPSCFCDVIAIKDNEIRKLEIRTGYKGMTGNEKIQFPRTLHTKNGIPTEFAVNVLSENKIYYEAVTEEDIKKYARIEL